MNCTAGLNRLQTRADNKWQVGDHQLSTVHASAYSIWTEWASCQQQVGSMCCKQNTRSCADSWRWRTSGRLHWFTHAFQTSPIYHTIRTSLNIGCTPYILTHDSQIPSIHSIQIPVSRTRHYSLFLRLHFSYATSLCSS